MQYNNHGMDALMRKEMLKFASISALHSSSQLQFQKKKDQVIVVHGVLIGLAMTAILVASWYFVAQW